jgi:hypothetical protein
MLFVGIAEARALFVCIWMDFRWLTDRERRKFGIEAVHWGRAVSAFWYGECELGNQALWKVVDTAQASGRCGVEDSRHSWIGRKFLDVGYIEMT